MCALGALLNWSGQSLLKSFQPFSNTGCIHQLGRLEGGGQTGGRGMAQNRGPLFPLSYFGFFKIAHLHLSPQEPWKLCWTIAGICEKAPQIASEIHKPLNPFASSNIWQALWEAATCRSSKIDASRKQRTLRTDVLISCSQLLDLWPK